MKKIAFSFAILFVLFAFTACDSKNVQDTVSAELGIDASDGKELSATDTHGGFTAMGVRASPSVSVISVFYAR